MNQFSNEIRIAQQLAREAGKVIMQIYSTGFSVQLKGKGDPVTDADKQANELIVKGLKQEFPQDGIVAEESPQGLSPKPQERIWYVDPLDGTKEFIAKNGEFSVMIGLAIRGSSRFGIVFRPDQDLLFGGVADKEAWVEEKGIKRPLAISPSQGEDRLRIAVSRSHRHPNMEKIQKKLEIQQEIQCGSVGLKVALIANGQADLYIEPGPFTSSWDSCAPEAIMRGSGGKFTDLFGAPVGYGTTQLKNKKGLVASNGVIHDQIIQTLSPIARQLYP
ncbi:MAG TPA: 3'(2'),5'-bisphosphate nucleotidase CysQ [Nitrospiria bacterium]|jgi:3'(2'), 5'-bisphosphate nucleotidase